MADTVKVTEVNHILKVGNSKIVILELEATYKNIGDAVGITLQGENDKGDDVNTIGNLKKNAKLITFNVRMKDKKTHRVNCSIDKASTAPANMIGKKIGDSEIKKVSVPRRRSRR